MKRLHSKTDVSSTANRAGRNAAPQGQGPSAAKHAPSASAAQGGAGLCPQKALA